MKMTTRLWIIGTTAAAVVVIGGSGSAHACALCFAAEEAALVDGAKVGILVMLGVLLAVQGGFAGFFFYLRKRGKFYADAELDAEWSEFQRGTRRS